MLINVKIPTIVGIITFNSMINTMSESLKERKKCYFCIILVRDEHKKFYNLGHGSVSISAS